MTHVMSFAYTFYILSIFVGNMQIYLTFTIKIFSETFEANLTKPCKDGPRLVLIQNLIPQPGPPSNMTSYVEWVKILITGSCSCMLTSPFFFCKIDNIDYFLSNIQIRHILANIDWSFPLKTLGQFDPNLVWN